MKIGFVIPARLTSSKLRRKLLMFLKGQSVLEWDIDRAKMVVGADEVVVATTAMRSDSEISRICIKKGIRYCQSSLEDVILRLRDTVRYFDFDYVVYVTPDNPLFSMYLADLIIREIKEDQSIDYIKYRYAMHGTRIYALKREAIETVCDFKPITDTEKWSVLFREPYFNVKLIDVPEFLRRDYRLTIDTDTDYRMISTIYRDMEISESNIPELYDVVKYLDEHPEVASINSKIVQRSTSEDLMKKVDKYFEDNKEEFYRIKEKYYG